MNKKTNDENKKTQNNHVNGPNAQKKTDTWEKLNHMWRFKFKK